MRLAFFGDVIGKSGRDGLTDHLPALKRDLKLDFVVVNAENAAGGFGITEHTAKELFMAGADCLTLGNHSWDQREALTYIVREPRLIRPVNYPRLMDAPGAGANLFETHSGKTVLVMNVLGRIHMDPMDCPFSAVEKELAACPMVMEEIAAIPAAERTGPLIIEERTGLPYRAKNFEQKWRRDFKAAELPADMWNRDLRVGGNTEASKGGASVEDRAKVGGH